MIDNESITHDECERKPVVIIQGELGSVIKGQPDKWHAVIPPKRSSGDIKGFSNASRRRLRERLALAKHIEGASSMLGVCLTIPGPIVDEKTSRRMWHNFLLPMRKYFPAVPFIWRIELQKRGQPHWHLVVWCPESVDVNKIKSSIIIYWFRCVDALGLDCKTIEAFLKHGIDFQVLDKKQAAGIIGYIADHTSKHKQDQLGWKGRQWGIVNKRMLSFDGSVVIEVEPDVHKQSARQLRRLQEKLRRDGKYTGCRVAPGLKVSTAVFGNDEKRYHAIVEAFSRIEQMELPLDSDSPRKRVEMPSDDGK